MILKKHFARVLFCSLLLLFILSWLVWSSRVSTVSGTFGSTTHHNGQIHLSSSYWHTEIQSREISNALFFALPRLPVRLVMVGWCEHCFNALSELVVRTVVCSFSNAIIAGWHSLLLSTSSGWSLRAPLVADDNETYHSESCSPATPHINLWAAVMGFCVCLTIKADSISCLTAEGTSEFTKTEEV